MRIRIHNTAKHPLNSIKKKNLNNYLPFSIQYYCPIVQTDQNSQFYLYALSLFAGSGTLIPDPDPGKSSGSMRIRIRIHDTAVYNFRSIKLCKTLFFSIKKIRLFKCTVYKKIVHVAQCAELCCVIGY